MATGFTSAAANMTSNLASPVGTSFPSPNEATKPFDPFAYLTNPQNQDVLKAYQQANISSGQTTNPYQFATQHYNTYGSTPTENRTWSGGQTTSATAPTSYLSANPDVMQAYQQAVNSGQKITANDYALQHYLTYGINEGRTWGSPASSTTTTNTTAQPLAGSTTTSSLKPPATTTTAPPATSSIQTAASGTQPRTLSDPLAYLYDPSNTDVLKYYQEGVANGTITQSPAEFARQHYAMYGFGEKREGAAGTDYVSKIGSTPPPTFTPRTITDKETVAGQLNTLLAEESPYIQVNRAQALAQMAGRGMLDSSMAAEAGQVAAIKAAGPIAAQDASTYSASALSAQNAGQTALTNQYNTQLGYLQNEANNTMRLQTESFLKQMDFDFEASQIAAQDRQTFASAIFPVMQQYSADFTNIQNDSDYDSPESKAAALADLKANYQTNINAIAGIYGRQVSWGSYTPAPPPPAPGNQAGAPPPASSAPSDPDAKYGEGRNDSGYRAYVDSFRPSIMFQTPMDYRSWKEQQNAG